MAFANEERMGIRAVQPLPNLPRQGGVSLFDASWLALYCRFYLSRLLSSDRWYHVELKHCIKGEAVSCQMATAAGGGQLNATSTIVV